MLEGVMVILYIKKSVFSGESTQRYAPANILYSYKQT